MRKTLYTLCVNDYEPQITKMTFPLMEKYAKKIGAEFYVIKDRKFPDMPPVYEKFQIYDLSKQRGDDWSIYVDADTAIYPDFFDVTMLVGKDTTISGMSSDFTPMRFAPDEYFLRDGRFIGKGNWFAVFSDWCRDYYRPLDDITFDEAVSRITPIHNENVRGIKADHLIDDYTVSRNIARFGLKHMLISQIMQQRGIQGPFFLHWYVPPDNWDKAFAEPTQGFTAQEFQEAMNEYGKPLKEFTNSEVKILLLKKNLALWKCL